MIHGFSPAGLPGQRLSSRIGARDATALNGGSGHPQGPGSDLLIEIIAEWRIAVISQRMMSREECLARAMELEAKMAAGVGGKLHEEYRELAWQWRTLANIAAAEESRLNTDLAARDEDG